MTWELDTARTWWLLAQIFLGKWADLAREWPALLREESKRRTAPPRWSGHRRSRRSRSSPSRRTKTSMKSGSTTPNTGAAAFYQVDTEPGDRLEVQAGAAAARVGERVYLEATGVMTFAEGGARS